MNMMLGIVVISIIVGMIGPVVGGLICAMFRKMSIKTESSMLSFAAGVMLAIVCFDLIPEAIGSNDDGNISIWMVILGVFIGYTIIHMLNCFMDKHFHHSHCHSHGDHKNCDGDDYDCIIEKEIEHKNKHINKDKCYQLLMAGIVMAIAISVHNFPEGIVIGASYAGGNGLLLSGSGFIISIMVGLHNIPAGVAISAPLVSGGMNKFKAVGIASLTGVFTVIGSMIGYYLGMVNEVYLSVLLSLASGTILNVIFCELLPEAFIMWRSKMTAWFVFIGMLIGILLICH